MTEDQDFITYVKSFTAQYVDVEHARVGAATLKQREQWAAVGKAKAIEAYRAQEQAA